MSTSTTTESDPAEAKAQAAADAEHFNPRVQRFSLDGGALVGITVEPDDDYAEGPHARVLVGTDAYAAEFLMDYMAWFIDRRGTESAAVYGRFEAMTPESSAVLNTAVQAALTLVGPPDGSMGGWTWEGRLLLLT